uniref:Ribosomal protein L16 n=1 Tax=Jakoba bahamiensis TaxID=221721 RepID=M4Q9R1_9EUKA|nr:ribosomal protein L16 [Jakoba bahamiensis]AGH24157.1 ribosomal protein L16 [Jakoba bahamiensis]
MVIPKKTKYRKYQKGRIKGIDLRSYVSFGEYGLQALSSYRLTERQIEACRVAITRKIRKIGKVWVRVFSDIPVTAKPTEVRMGKGKGSIDHWIVRIKPGKILFEVSGVPYEMAKRALELGAYKLPIPTKVISKDINHS